ncbi:peptide chain release factor 3 [Buchnera aphidicola (Pemphigus obesinymphae)]|uniref:peptide chain release factor 3 n=2 Tax=Buchnera aphidicola TaxID=9 RepID=UPI002237A844|nr:peptide chain release factor 3 [Buchnera aphidicola]MCW5196438.1 peptide chain release factor 3 [Buchnera aphidicola (Pemphigus obesinymphae)]
MIKKKSDLNFLSEVEKRRTFAIISHPDSGKTTITEKILLLGKVIHKSGTVKARGSGTYVTSDWMKIEKKRGISITSSVMQFYYKFHLINLLDTPGHQDFSEDTYRIITAVDCCLMIIDAAKGVEERTKKLINITRLRNTPIITFINKLDRDAKDPIELFDDIENKLKISCTPITWPINCGRLFQGIYHIHDKGIWIYKKNVKKNKKELFFLKIPDLNNILLDKNIGTESAHKLREEVELIKGCYSKFERSFFLKGNLTPVFFGSALSNFGVDHMLHSLINWAPCPTYKKTDIRKVESNEENFSGFIFKIQANMDSKHRDRVAFMRIVSGKYVKGIKLLHVRTGKYIVVNDALIFLAGDRFSVDSAYPGDIIGIHNHGTIRIGDTFTQGERIKFIGIPNFAPEIFRCIRLTNPFKQKQLLKGLKELSEEGAVQTFRPILNNNLILGVIGELQFDVVIERLKEEYFIEAVYDSVNIVAARWISSSDSTQLNKFKLKYISNLAIDGNNELTYIAPSLVNLNIVIMRYPNIIFSKFQEN